MLQGLNDPLYAPGQQTMGTKYWEGPEKDPYDILAKIEEVHIVEKVKGMEVLTGFETGNKYKIKDARTGCDLFLAVECKDGMMGAIGRNAMSGGNRPFNLKVGMLRGDGVPPERFALLQRPFKCTCGPFNRPEVFMLDSRTQEQFGKIEEPCAPCKFKLTLTDDTGQPYGEMEECCTVLCCFGTPCNKEAKFPVKNTKGTPIANIDKRATAATLVTNLTGLVVDADNFVVTFTPEMTPKQKMHMISTALFMDFCYFTKSGAEGGESGAGMLGGAIGGEGGAAIGAFAGFAMGAVAAASKPKAVEW